MTEPHTPRLPDDAIATQASATNTSTQHASHAAANPSAAKFVTGSTLRHVVNMTAAASVGLVAIFAVDALNLFYISLLGHKELAAAVGYAGTLLFFCTSVLIGLSISATALTSRALGSGDLPQARQIAGASLLILIAVALVLTTVLFPLLRPLLALLGATGETLRLALQFSRIVLPALVLLGLGMGISALLRALGDAKRAMWVTLGSALTTVMTDPLFIFGFDMGLAGAGVSTIVARLVMVGIGFYGLVRVHGLFAWPSMETLKNTLKPFVAIGVPAILTQIATPVGNAFVTQAMAQYGDEAVAGWAVIGRIIPVAFGVIFALSGAVGPIVGQNLGAKRLDRISQTVRDALLVTLVVVLIAWLLLALLHNPIASAFGATGLARELITFFCLFVAGSFLFNGMLFVANAVFNNLGYALYSTLLNWGRSTIGVLPFIWLGAQWGGAQGVLAGYGLGVVAFGIMGWLLVRRVIRRLDSTQV